MVVGNENPDSTILPVDRYSGPHPPAAAGRPPGLTAAAERGGPLAHAQQAVAPANDVGTG